MSRRVILSIILLALAAGLVYFWMLANSDGNRIEKVGFVKAVTTNGNYGIVFDEAEWLSGKEGEDAAIAAGLCTEAMRSQCLPNEFLINNPSSATQNLEFLTGITITMQTLGMETDGVQEKEISKQEFERLLNDPRQHWRNLPYRVTMQGGLVRSIEEIYIP